MHRPVQTGRESLLHSRGVIVDIDRQLNVRAQGELWTADVEILKRRLARGEISQEEYRRLRDEMNGR